LITNNGKGILAKYLIGQISSYASYIAIGVGPKPFAEGQALPPFENKTSLDFEVFRVPIVSRGYVYDENGVANVVFAAELPTDQRYEITEVGIFPGSSNPAAGVLDSKMIYTFSGSENWKYHSSSAENSIETYIEPLNLEEEENSIFVNDKAFFANADNVVLNDPFRVLRYERTRFLRDSLFMAGNMSNLEEELDGSNIIGLLIRSENGAYFGEHIHLTGTNPGLDRNSLKDDLRLAFSIIDKKESQSESIDTVRIMVEFSSTDSDDPTSFARYFVNMPGSEFITNRYHVVPMLLQNLRKSAGFTWNTVNVTKIYASVIGAISAIQKQILSNVATVTLSEDHGFEVGDAVTISGLGEPYDGDHTITGISNDSISFPATATDEGPFADGGTVKGPSGKFFVALDGMKLENNTAESPIYGLVGYSVVRTPFAQTVLKRQNTSNIVEFRFGVDAE
jgi:hypothetical protein